MHALVMGITKLGVCWGVFLRGAWRKKKRKVVAKAAHQIWGGLYAKPKRGSKTGIGVKAHSGSKKGAHGT